MAGRAWPWRRAPLPSWRRWRRVVATVVFVAAVGFTRVISLGSVAATLTLPPAAWVVGAPTSVVVAASGIATLILFRHRANVRRIARGTERRFGEAR